MHVETIGNEVRHSDHRELEYSRLLSPALRADRSSVEAMWRALADELSPDGCDMERWLLHVATKTVELLNTDYDPDDRSKAYAALRVLGLDGPRDKFANACEDLSMLIDFASIDGTKVTDRMKANFLKAKYPDLFAGRSLESIRNTIRSLERRIEKPRR